LICLDAARWAPSANNSQPWEFIVIKGEETRRKLASMHTWGRFMSESPVVICVVADPKRSPGYYHGDAAVATQNILLAAWAQGIGTCWIGVIDTEFEGPIKKLLNIPKALRVLCLVSMGYPAERPRSQRRDLASMVHKERYGAR
jgi:nitroreductase